MKKLIITITLLCIMFSLVGCNSNDQDSKTNKTDTMDIDEGLLEVNITVPASFFVDNKQEVSQESLNEEVNKKGFVKATLNKDGSVTYVMTRNKHKQLMNEIVASIENSLQEVIDDDGNTITSIKHNNDFDEFEVQLSSSEVGINEAFLAITFYMYGGMYNIFNGNEVNNISIRYLDSSGNLIKEVNSKDSSTK